MSKSLSKLSNIAETKNFQQQLAFYKKEIDADILAYSKLLESQVSEQFGENSRLALDVFNSVLGRGGKRIRGALTMLAYEMFSGQDKAVALQAARAIEMIQAYLLIVDDIADRSDVRRGGPSAHIMLKNWHEKQHLKDDATHFGESIAMNAAMFGNHMAFDIITELNVSSDVKLNAIKTLNKNLIITAHGQFNDIFNEVLESDNVDSIENVLVWKTAYYTFISPLQFGAELTGVTNGNLDVLAKYGIHAGRAFQISDDIVGMFGAESESGKSPHDDIREGKRTLIIAYALEKADAADAYFLRQCLGNHNLTSADFARCQEIVRTSGALAYAKEQVVVSANAAVEVLDAKTQNWDASAVQFLRQLVQYLVDRKS